MIIKVRRSGIALSHKSLRAGAYHFGRLERVRVRIGLALPGLHIAEHDAVVQDHVLAFLCHPPTRIHVHTPASLGQRCRVATHPARRPARTISSSLIT